LVTVRLLAGNTVYGFASQILRICRLPFPCLHLSYPRTFESMVVRKAQCASANVIASVENSHRAIESSEPFSAKISDLSVASAMLEASTPMGAVADAIMIRAKVQVAGLEKYLALAAVVRAVRTREATEPLGKRNISTAWNSRCSIPKTSWCCTVSSTNRSPPARRSDRAQVGRRSRRHVIVRRWHTLYHWQRPAGIGSAAEINNSSPLGESARDDASSM
jgi:hypothetical protein